MLEYELTMTLIITAANYSVPLLNLRKLKQYTLTQIASFSSMHAYTISMSSQVLFNTPGIFIRLSVVLLWLSRDSGKYAKLLK